MKKSLIWVTAITLSMLPARAEETENLHKSDYNNICFLQKPTYLKNVTEAANWGRNWFIEFKGGASFFLGKPLGCGDMHDRIKPALQVGLGKWHIPAVGGRIMYQGFKFKDGNLLTERYHNVHADFLFNTTSMLNVGEDGLSRWDVIPYLGAGLIFHKDNKNRPFSLHYGLMARYKIASCLHLVGELGGLSTFRNFDGIGSSKKLGDNMLSLSFGLNLTLGKGGWRKIIDAQPYIKQNEVLIDYSNALKKERDELAMKLQKNDIIIKEYEKILEIEGLLKKYQKNVDNVNLSSNHPRNNYSGLNSLRARLAEKKIIEGNDSTCLISDSLSTGNTMTYIQGVIEGKQYIGSPIYFFFELGTTKLTDASQKLNLDELAKVAKEHSLFVSVKGAADSATGTETINDKLSQDRAEMIKMELKNRGVDETRIRKVAKGGIKEHNPNEANRHTIVTLYMK